MAHSSDSAETRLDHVSDEGDAIYRQGEIMAGPCRFTAWLY